MKVSRERHLPIRLLAQFRLQLLIKLCLTVLRVTYSRYVCEL